MTTWSPFSWGVIFSNTPASGAASGQATLAVGTQRAYLMLFGAADALIAVRLG